MNSKRGRLILLISIVFALVGAALIYYYLQDLGKPLEISEKTEILVATVEIKPKTLITDEMVSSVTVDEQSVYGNFVNDRAEIVGKFAKDTIYPSERFVSNKLLDSNADELSLQIDGNYRAISLVLNSSSGVSDMLKPGDFIDIFLTLKSGGEENVVRPDVTKVILQNIEIIALDKILDRDNVVRAEIAPSFNVVLAVPIEDVEGLILAESIGSLKVALRPYQNDYLYASGGTVWPELFLDDFERIKNFFPEYEVVPDEDLLVEAGQYTYNKYVFYSVKYGDTLRSISKLFYGTENNYLLLKQINKIEDEDNILAGTGIMVPVLDEPEMPQETDTEE